MTAGAFFGVLPDQAGGDPHVVYDPVHQRWLGTLISHDCTNGYLYLAVSQTSDPSGTWTHWYFTYSGRLPDYPDIGISTDKVVIGANEFAVDPTASDCLAPTTSGSSLLIIDWSAILAGSVSPDAYYAADLAYWTWRPSRNLSADPTIYLIAEATANAHVMYATLTGTVAQSNVMLSPVDLSSLSAVPFGPEPPQPQQPGAPTTIAMAVDGRPTDAIWQNGSLWFTATFGCTPMGSAVVHDCVRVTQVTTSPSVAVRQDFPIAYLAYDAFMPGIGLSADGTAYVVYSATSPTHYVSTWANAQATSDPPNTVEATALIASGAGTYNGTRWGDYVGVAIDPVNPRSVWQADEYPDAAGRWATRLSQLTLDSTPPVGTFAINGGAPTTFSPVVTIADTATDDYSGVSQLAVSNDGATWATYAYGTSLPWDVTNPAYGGTLSIGTKTVYMQWADGAGNWSVPTSHSITLTAGTTYVAAAPARVLDTRFGTGLSGVFAANVARTFTVAGVGGVPSNALAVTGNLTVTQQTAAGYLALTVLPTSTPATSTLNFPLGDTRANNVAIPLSPSGTLSAVYKAGAGSTIQLIFDVTGYFLADDSGATYAPVSPTRILDSRAAFQVGPYATPFQSNGQREIPVWGLAGVPSTATAVTGNLTISGQTSAGYLALSNINTSSPATSTLNVPLGDTRANGVSVALTGTGSLWAVYKAPAGKTANVIFDVTGYYVPGTSGLHFIPITPGRLLDGRPAYNLGLAGPFGANASRQLGVDGHLGVPVGANAITGNLTVTGQTSAGYAAITPDPNNNPSTSTVNFPLADTRANGVTVRLNGAGNISLVYKAASGTTYLILDVTGYFK